MYFLIILLFIFLSFFSCIAGAVLVNTLLLKPPGTAKGKAPLPPPLPLPEPPFPEALARLSKAVSIPSVSPKDAEYFDPKPFDDFIAFLGEAYPLFHKRCVLTRVNGYALLYRWKGRDSALKPLILTAHYDVVPAEDGNTASRGSCPEWTYPPFSGQLAEGRIWGRGTLDIKSQITAHLEAAETLLQEGFVPERDFWFIYGHDEESGGTMGAKKAAEYLAEQGIRAEGVLDEGGFVEKGVFKGEKPPLALIGVAEKGFCNYEISVEDEGGHSSMPPLHTAPGKAALLIREIEGHPLPSRLTPPLAGMLRNIAGETSFPVRMVLANLWLFKPLLFKMFSANSTTRAMVRSTFAVTMARSGDAPNVLPRKAKFTVNARLLQGDTVESAAAYLDTLAKKVFRRLKENQGEGAKSPGFTITPRAAENPSAVSPASGKLYEKIKIIIAELCPDAVISPYLVTGGTDARKYSSITEHVYRFTPILVTNEEKNTIHNTNESISVENYGRMILFYRRLIEGFDKP